MLVARTPLLEALLLARGGRTIAIVAIEWLERTACEKIMITVSLENVGVFSFFQDISIIALDDLIYQVIQ